MVDFAFSPATITVPAGTTVVWTNQDAAAHTTTSDTDVWDSGSMAQGQPFSATFNSPGTFPYLCTIHPFMGGTVAVTEASVPTPTAAATATPAETSPPPAPTLAGPADGAALPSFGPTLTWANPAGTTQYHLQVIPANNDGPGVDVHIGSAGTSFPIPAPPQWYGLLPDITYTWQVRVSDASTFIALDDPS